MTATLELVVYAGPSCCPLCGGLTDDDVFHDDINDRQTCSNCCAFCRDERNNEQ